ncbi:MAG: hypothetical protein GX331_03015 [Firmicutes bacterium]|jgi:hypothetical protein|nr:hypothetical protein [Bacillota bacterium]
MNIVTTKEILAVVTLDRNKVAGQGLVFYAENEEELSETALLLARVLAAAVHDLKNGTMILVRH